MTFQAILKCWRSSVESIETQRITDKIALAGKNIGER
jgi:hypothetical protein